MSDGVQPEPADEVEAALEVVASAERTLAERSVRIALRQDLTLPRIERPRRPGLVGMAARLAGSAVRLLFRAYWRRVARGRGGAEKLELGQLAGEGIAEPAKADS